LLLLIEHQDALSKMYSGHTKKGRGNLHRKRKRSRKNMRRFGGEVVEREPTFMKGNLQFLESSSKESLLTRRGKGKVVRPLRTAELGPRGGKERKGLRYKGGGGRLKKAEKGGGIVPPKPPFSRPKEGEREREKKGERPSPCQKGFQERGREVAVAARSAFLDQAKRRDLGEIKDRASKEGYAEGIPAGRPSKNAPRLLPKDNLKEKISV